MLTDARLGQRTSQRMWTRDRVQSKAIKMIKGMESMSQEERLTGRGQEKRKLQGKNIYTNKLMKDLHGG